LAKGSYKWENMVFVRGFTGPQLFLEPERAWKFRAYLYVLF